MAELEKNLLDNKKLVRRDTLKRRGSLEERQKESEEENRKFKEYREQQLKLNEEMEEKLKKLEEEKKRQEESLKNRVSEKNYDIHELSMEACDIVIKYSLEKKSTDNLSFS